MKPLCSMILTALVLVALSISVQAEPADASAEGTALLAEGKIAEAVEAFDAAAKANPGDKKILIARAQAKKLETYLDQVAEGNDVADRAKAMDKLHKFYHSHGLYAVSLDMEQSLYKAAANDATAALLADTLLATQEDEQALAVLQAAGVERESWDVKALLGIALARAGQKEQAQALLDEVKEEERLTSAQAKNLAALLALTGNQQEAEELLVILFGATTKDKLPALKEAIQASPDFQAMAGTEGFKSAMATEAKLKGCGGDCGSCPSEGCK